MFATSTNNLRSEGANWFDNTGLVDGSRIGFSADWGIAINNDGTILAGLSDGLLKPTRTITASTGLNDGQPHTVFFTRSDTEISIHVDDEAAVTSAINNAITRANDLDLTIGGLLSSDGPFTGDIAEVRVYDGALSNAEIGTVRDELTAFYSNSAAVAVDDSYDVDEDASFGLIVSQADGVLSNDTTPMAIP